jgi:hypothetical protein
MLEFFAVHAPWQRRLWTPGAELRLREVLEAAEGVAARALMQPSLDWYARAFADRVNVDPGLGDTAQRTLLRTALARGLVVGSENERVLRHLAEDVHERYLERWKEALTPEQHGHQSERVARLLAGHLLDRGLSQDHLHRWLTYIKDHDSQEYDAPGLIAAADQLLQAKTKRFRVFIPCETPYPSGISAPKQLLDIEAADRWLADRGLAHLAEGVQHRGGLLLNLRASDPEAAVAIAADIVDALQARIAVGTRGSFSAHRHALVAGERSRRFLLRRPRRVEVRALEREGRVAEDVYAMVESPVDAALHLLSYLDTGPTETAVSGGWSAIESLLTAPGDEGGNVVAGDRLAVLVACAWPRAELTTLAARRIGAVHDAFTERLRTAASNRDRAELIAEAIRAGIWLQLTDPADEAAVRRVEKLLRLPNEVLPDLERYATDAFRRLYRQRNLVVHGGRTTGAALKATLRTVAPLVGAGMDRIVHAYLTDGVEPLDLVARGRLEVARAGSKDAPEVTRMLEWETKR